MDFRILGPFEVVRDTEPIALPRGRGRALLALLVLRAGEVVPTDRLIDQLWGPAPPPTAAKSLHNLIFDLRRRLAPDGSGGGDAGVLVTSGSGYALQVDPGQVDAARFRQLLDEAAQAPAADRANTLRAALELWRGPALADLAYEPFAQADIAVLEELRRTAVEDRIDADLALGRHATLVGELQGLVAQHPYRERLRALLMLALYRCGRQADALAAYQAGREALVEELGIEPGKALADLERAILNHDPSLEMSATPASDTAADAARVATEAWLDAERKTVTVAYVEFVELGSDGEADPETLQRLVARGVEVATTVVEAHGGTVEGFVGGVLVAVFGVPTAREDDALRAAGAALALRDAVTALPGTADRDAGPRLVARIGINTGEVVVTDAASWPAVASGDAVGLAARLQRAAGDGDVLIGEPTRQLLGEGARVESVASLVLDRTGRPATVWRLVALAPGDVPRARDRSQPLVGRQHELTRLHGAFQRTLRVRTGSRFTVTGDAGVGKSRLALEFVDTLAGDVEVLWCRCLAYGEGSTFGPLRDLVVQSTGDRGLDGLATLLAGHDDASSIAAQIAGAIGLRDGPGSGSELFPAVRRLLQTLADSRPMVVIVDDAHWAPPTFLDLVDYLTELIEAPLLIVCFGRPELVDQRHAWRADPGGWLVLEPLPPADSERMVTQRLAGRLVPDEVVTQVVEMAQGNPLFIEQLLAALRDEGRVHLPASVHALLAARLDRLGPAERDLLRCAAVVGTEFSREALTALVPDRARDFVARHLEALQRKELIDPTNRAFLGGRAYAFRHALVQQAAYRSTTRQTRAELHSQLADWLAARDDADLEEIVAYHLEQAHGQRRQLGLDDEDTRDLALRAGRGLASAGLRAYDRFDMTAAENLLARARALLPTEHPQRFEVLRRLSQAYPTLGRLADAETVVTELLEDPRVSEDGRLLQRSRLELLRIRLIAGPDPVRHDTIRAEVAQALAVLEPLEDDVGMSQACYLLATMHLRSGQIDALEEVGRRGLEHARRSGDLREELGAVWWPTWALVVGPTPVPDAIASCEDLMRRYPTHIAVMTDLARLQAMRGRFEAARELVARARRQVIERIRVRRALTVVAHRAAEVEILAGDLDAAEGVLRPAVEVALDIDERDQTAQLAAELSRVLSARGAAQEAVTFAAISRRQAPAESVTAQALWRTATARALLLGGDTVAAQRLAREAVGLVPTDLVNLRAELHVDLAAALVAAGEHQAASAASQEAADLYGRKGNLVGFRAEAGA